MAKRFTKFGPVPRTPSKAPKRVTVSNEFFTASAVWKRINGHWTCTFADHPLRWMLYTPFSKIRIELIRLGADWKWEKISDSVSSTAAIDNPLADQGNSSVGTRYATLPGAHSLDPLLQASASAAS